MNSIKMTESIKKRSKRLDLQGIRAVAILVVLGFHFFPTQFPNGYLGVDQFFVLSGFLMCMLLKRAEGEAVCTLISLFYSKRFKRILPLYLLFVFVSMLALYNVFPDTAIETNQESATKALLFVSNRPKTVQEDYFLMLDMAVDIFTHTWSLSVEIQFYFLVPIIFLIGNRFSTTMQYIFYLVLGFISFVFFATSPPTVAFNNVFARIWQFLIGMTVYFFTATAESGVHYQMLRNDEEDGMCEKLLNGDDESIESESDTFARLVESARKLSRPAAYVLLISLIAIMTSPFAFPASFFRPFVTCSTGILMLVSEENRILSNALVTYIGDISYSLYLIHWPFYAYWKLTAQGNEIELFGCLAASVVLAVITFETFEKWYLRLSSTSVGAIVVILFVANVVLINRDEIRNQVETGSARLDNVTQNMTMDDAEHLNYRWSVNDNKNLYTNTCIYERMNTPLGWCRHTGLSPSGKYKLMILGNSWTANHAKMFYQECRHQAKSILQGSAFGCEPLYPTGHSKRCQANFTDFEDRVKKEKPDYAFIITRYMSTSGPFPKNVTSFDKDPTYQIMKNQTLKMIKNIRKKLFILDYIPRTNSRMIGQIVSLLRNHTAPVEIDKLLIRPDNFEMGRRRNAQLMRDCGKKCQLIDYVPEFWNNATGTFRYFDERGFSYMTTPIHMSPHGIEHVRHVWRDICGSL